MSTTGFRIKSKPNARQRGFQNNSTFHELPCKERSCANGTGARLNGDKSEDTSHNSHRLNCQINVSHNALFFQYDHACINFISALTSCVDHVPCSQRTLARRTYKLMSFCSFNAEATARIHTTRAVFLFFLTWLFREIMEKCAVDNGLGSSSEHDPAHTTVETSVFL